MSMENLFHRSIQPLQILLKVFGLHFVIVPGRKTTLSNYCWTLFWLILNLQVFLFILIRTALPVLVRDDVFVWEMSSFVSFFAHINPAITGLLCHTKLVLILRDDRSVINRVLSNPASINPKRRSTSSILGVVCIITTIFFNSGFLIGWDYWNPRRSGSFLSARTTYKHLAIAVHSLFGWSSAILYAILAHHSIHQYHQSVINRRMNKTPSNIWSEITPMLKEFQQLDSSARLLIKDFAPILFVLCFSSWISCLTASYFMILSFFDGRLLYLVLTWDTFQIVESICRLVLLCWTTDQLVHASPLKGIEELRELRNRCVTSQANRIKITLVIVELSHRKNNYSVFAVVRLLGFLPLSSHLIIQTIETVLGFLVVLYQFKIGQGF